MKQFITVLLTLVLGTSMSFGQGRTIGTYTLITTANRDDAKPEKNTVQITWDETGDTLRMHSIDSDQDFSAKMHISNVDQNSMTLTGIIDVFIEFPIHRIKQIKWESIDNPKDHGTIHIISQPASRSDDSPIKYGISKDTTGTLIRTIRRKSS